MAGANKILRSAQLLFKAGDPSDGMYLVRKGELQIFLDQGDQEVQLAKVGSGSLIGEMALFDQKPRSAHVRALTDTEVTHISNEDFKKLMKQIPKWFVSLMITLSTRLRDTNERLKKIEMSQKGSGPPFQNVIKMLHVINLLLFKDGVKEGKLWTLEVEIIIKTLKDMFSEPQEKIESLLKVLESGEVLLSKINNYKNKVIILPNKATLTKFIQFLTLHASKCEQYPCWPPEAMEMMEIFLKKAAKSAYDTYTTSIEELQADGAKQKMATENWLKKIDVFKSEVCGDTIKITKSSSGGLAFNIRKKDLEELYRSEKTIASIFREKLG